MTKTSMLLNFGQDIIEYITGFFGDFLYNTIGHIIILLLDWLQSIFRGLAGLEGMKINGQSVNGVGEDSYDIVYWLIGTDIIMEIFWSMILFSAVLLIIMTIIALVRNTYEEKQKPVWDIISSSFKGLLGFIIVPAFAVVGLMFSNVILRTIDAGTSFGNSSMMSTNLFMSAAYDANKLRGETVTDCEKAFKQIVDKTNFESYKNVQSYYDGIGTLTLQDYHNTLAPLLDEAFTGGQLKRGSSDVLTPQDTIDVKICYATFEINYLILLAGGCVLVGVFFKMCWGMIGRIFKLCFDFVLIPVVNAMIPFDGGNAMKSWKGDFVKNVTMAYGTVGILNLYFSILPVVNDIQFNNGGLQSTGFFSAIFKLILQIVGIFSASSIMSTVNGWFGVGDVVSAGDSTFKAFQGGLKSIKSGFGVKDKAKKATKKAMAIQGAYLGGRKASNAKGLKAFGAGLLGAFGQTEMSKTLTDLNWAKNVNEAKKKGAESYNDSRIYGAGLNSDLWSRETNAYDAAKSRVETQKSLANFAKSNSGLNESDPGDLSVLQKRFMETAEGKAMIDFGGFNIGGKTSTEFQNELQKEQGEREKFQKGTTAVQQLYDAMKARQTAYQAARASGVRNNDIRAFLRGDNSVLAGKTDEQRRALQEALDAQNSIYSDSLKDAAVFLGKQGILTGPSLVGKTEETLRQMNSDALVHALTSDFGLDMGATSGDTLAGELQNLVNDMNAKAVAIDAKEKQLKSETYKQKQLLDKYYKDPTTLTDAEKKQVKLLLAAIAKKK